MKLKGLILVVTALVANIGITNAEQISTPFVVKPLGTKITQVDRTQSLEVMPYMESKVTGETELSYAVMSLAKKHITNKYYSSEMKNRVCILILMNIIEK